MLGSKILMGIGGACLGLALIVFVIAVALPVVTDGRTSWDEAMPGIIGGAVCTALSFLITVGGITWFVLARKKK